MMFEGPGVGKSIRAGVVGGLVAPSMAEGEGAESLVQGQKLGVTNSYEAKAKDEALHSPPASWAAGTRGC